MKAQDSELREMTPEQAVSKIQIEQAYERGQLAAYRKAAEIAKRFDVKPFYGITGIREEIAAAIEAEAAKLDWN